MQEYIGSKRVFRTPMTRLEYNQYRGWDLPEDEDGSEKGYLVEYVDGGKPNHPDHKGYISWSPKDIFDRNYEPLGENSVTKGEVALNMVDRIVKTVVEFDKPVTYVTVRMVNGFTLRESTTCVDPANYDESIGEEICLKRMEDKIWLLLGYALQSRMSL